MAKTRVFCSFNYDEVRNLKDLLIDQSKNEDSWFEVYVWSMKERARRGWGEEAERRIKRCDQVIVVLGQKTHSASGVKKEVKMTRRNGMPIFQLKPQDTNSIPVDNAGKVYNWTWDTLKELLS